MVTAIKAAPQVARSEQRHETALPVSRRRRKMRSVVFARAVFCSLGLLFMLGYIGLYAQVTLYGYRRAELASQIRQVEMKNQALKAEIQTLSSPERLSAAAARAGMAPGVNVVYVPLLDHVKVARAD